jgi:hypothetical protein
VECGGGVMFISDVDQYMFEVEKAIRKYIKNPEQFTEIYNRCYEAVAKAIRETQEKNEVTK